MALIKKEVVGSHTTKVRSRQRGKLLLQNLKHPIRPISLAPARSPRTSSRTCQRKVRTERPTFSGDSPRRHFVIYHRCKLRELWPRFHPNPKHPRGFRRRKETISVEVSL